MPLYGSLRFDSLRTVNVCEPTVKPGSTVPSTPTFAPSRGTPLVLTTTMIEPVSSLTW